MSATVATNTRISSSRWECMPSPRSSMLPTISPARKRAEVAAAACVVDREVAAPTTTRSTAMIGDSRQIPSRRVETATREERRRSRPQAVEMPRSTRNSPNGEASDPSPSITNDAERQREHRAGDVVERRLGDDRLRHLGRMRMCSKSGMRIAGSVGARTAPMRRPTSNGTSKATAATAPVTNAVMTTPGIASRPRPSDDRAQHASESAGRRRRGSSRRRASGGSGSRPSRAAGRSGPATSGPSSAPAATGARPCAGRAGGRRRARRRARRAKTSARVSMTSGRHGRDSPCRR